MIKIDVQKNLIGLEDLLIGTGTEEQTRGPLGTAKVSVTRINGANLPYDDEFSLQQKFDTLQIAIDSLPNVVDEDGNLLAGYIQTSELNLNLDEPNRLWHKEISSALAQLYYGDKLLLEYRPDIGNLIVPGDSDYIAADVIVTAAFVAADTILEDSITLLDLATEAIHDLDVGTAPNNLVQLDSEGKLPAVDGSQLTGIDNGVPIGALVDVPYSTPDANWLECNGAEISRTTYAALFAKIGTLYGEGDETTTFNIPDYRGEFRRTWDNGRDIDTGRELGTYQTEEIKSHLHDEGDLTTDSAGSHAHTYKRGSGASGSSGPVWQGNSAFNVNTSSAGNHTHTLTGSTGSTGGEETRPRNVSVMTMIKAL